MLNQGRVLQYIKMNLAFPFQLIEYTDTQILEYIITFSLREFSYYVPDVITIPYNLGLDSNKVIGKDNEFYIQDEQGLEILNIVNIYFSNANLMMFGHPPLGPMGFSEIKNWALDVEMANMIKGLSNWNYTFEFKAPNRVRISPSPVSEGHVAIEYERMQPPDLSKIPNDLQMLYCDLALSDIMILIGRLRKRYEGNLKSPFGEIPISAEILDEGKEKRAALIEKLTAGTIPNMSIDFF
jgi:hypothetical protein